MKLDYIRIGKRITMYRCARRMSQAKLAEAIFCSPSYISHIERGVKTPSLEILIKISESLQVTIDQLLSLGAAVPPDESSYSDYQALLTGCTPEERTIILSNAQNLKQLLHDASKSNDSHSV